MEEFDFSDEKTIEKIPPEGFDFFERDLSDPTEPTSQLRTTQPYFSILVRMTSFSSHTGEWCSADSQLMSPVPMRQMPRK